MNFYVCLLLSAERQEAEPSSVNAQQTVTPSRLGMGGCACGDDRSRDPQQQTPEMEFQLSGWVGFGEGGLQSSC